MLSKEIMQRYKFTGLTDSYRLVETMVDQSKMDREEAWWMVRHYLERCVEVWEGEKLVLYVLVSLMNDMRSIHAYKIGKGRTRHAIRIYLNEMEKIKGQLFSCHRESDQHVARLFKILGFKEIGRAQNEIIYKRQEEAISV